MKRLGIKAGVAMIFLAGVHGGVFAQQNSIFAIGGERITVFLIVVEVWMISCMLTVTANLEMLAR